MKKDIKKSVMRKIEEGEVKIKPRKWFHFAKFGIAFLVGILALIAVIVSNYAIYIPKRMGAFRHFGPGENPPELPLIPWPLIIVSVLLVCLAVWIYREYESGYKKNISLILIVSIICVLFFGVILALSGINERFEQHPGMRDFYQWQQDSFGYREGPPGTMMR